MPTLLHRSKVALVHVMPPTMHVVAASAVPMLVSTVWCVCTGKGIKVLPFRKAVAEVWARVQATEKQGHKAAPPYVAAQRYIQVRGCSCRHLFTVYFLPRMRRHEEGALLANRYWLNTCTYAVLVLFCRTRFS